ncbi:MAG: hypothetical protein FJY97_08485 [candidate division Zixibacteria bacterium]|nr:hypothetical protein [candidate division Zixibacteria bacterium]
MPTFLIGFLALAVLSGTTKAQTPRAGAERLMVYTAPDVLFQESLSPVATVPKIKSPVKAFLFSAIFPGAGELYAGRKRGLLFSALEVGGVAAYVVLRQKGNDRKKNVLDFADAHWDSTRCAPECLDPAVGTERLGEYGSQQYYEQIGKYNKFQEGWDDYTPGATELSPNRKTYVGKRHDMNRAFKSANRLAGLLLFNHVVSAVHAALLVRSDRHAALKESRLSIDVDGYMADGYWTSSARVTYVF